MAIKKKPAEQPGEGDPAGNPSHPHWQGHTHPWPDEPDEDGLLTCPDCGLRQSPELIGRVDG